MLFTTFFLYIINAKNPSSNVEYDDSNNFEWMSDNPFESDNNLEQADASDVNVNQSLYLDTKTPVLPTRQNNLLRTLGNMASIMEFDLIQSSSPPRSVANNILLAKFVN